MSKSNGSTSRMVFCALLLVMPAALPVAVREVAGVSPGAPPAAIHVAATGGSLRTAAGVAGPDTDPNGVPTHLRLR